VQIEDIVLLAELIPNDLALNSTFLEGGRTKYLLDGRFLYGRVHVLIPSHKEEGSLMVLQLHMPREEISSNLIRLLGASSTSTFQPEPLEDLVQLISLAELSHLQAPIVCIGISNPIDTQGRLCHVPLNHQLAIEHWHLVIDDLGPITHAASDINAHHNWVLLSANHLVFQPSLWIHSFMHLVLLF